MIIQTKIKIAKIINISYLILSTDFRDVGLKTVKTIKKRKGAM